MLTVAPSGSVNPVIFLETPAFLFTQLIVKGRVDEEDAVEKAVRSAGDIAR